jgi:hypothetical protein
MPGGGHVGRRGLGGPTENGIERALLEAHAALAQEVAQAGLARLEQRVGRVEVADEQSKATSLFHKLAKQAA